MWYYISLRVCYNGQANSCGSYYKILGYVILLGLSCSSNVSTVFNVKLDRALTSWVLPYIVVQFIDLIKPLHQNKSFTWCLFGMFNLPKQNIYLSDLAFYLLTYVGILLYFLLSLSMRITLLSYSDHISDPNVIV